MLWVVLSYYMDVLFCQKESLLEITTNVVPISFWKRCFLKITAMISESFESLKSSLSDNFLYLWWAMCNHQQRWSGLNAFVSPDLTSTSYFYFLSDNESNRKYWLAVQLSCQHSHLLCQEKQLNCQEKKKKIIQGLCSSLTPSIKASVSDRKCSHLSWITVLFIDFLFCVMRGHALYGF